MKKIRILSVDGGGIRGIIPGTILAQLEKILQRQSNSTRKLGDYFDMIAGTSTGGILSCLYLMPDEDGNARYSAQDAVDLYIKNGHTIFDRTLAEKIKSLGGILHEKYSQDPIYKLLTTYFGEVTLDKLIKPSLITAYDITDRKAVFFTSADARNDNIYNFKVRDIARATAAAPTYFSPAHIESLNGQIFSLVDGGMFANNPALCAYAEARKLEFSKFFNDPQKKDKPAAADMVIVSLGTGSVKKQYHKDRTAGLEYYKQQGIKTYATKLTDDICKEHGEKRAEFLMDKDTVFKVGQYSFSTYFPGQGHTPDNIVIWFNKDKILYGGCFIKSTEATDLGYIAEANVKEWGTSIKNTQKKFRNPRYIIPGHQDWTSTKSLDHTLELIKEAEQKK